MGIEGTVPPVTEFTIEEERLEGGETGVITLGGDVDLHTAPQLRERLARAIDDGVRTLVVDLARVTFIDSMTLGVLLGASKRLRPRGGQLRLVVSEPSVRKIFEITLLDRVFELHESRDGALSAAAA
jgi:anti-sigma B factor antagonist